MNKRKANTIPREEMFLKNKKSRLNDPAKLEEHEKKVVLSPNPDILIKCSSKSINIVSFFPKKI
jgi:hypothetical protein